MRLKIVAGIVSLVGIISFAFPFAVVSPVGERTELIHFTGTELLMGTTFQRGFQYGERRVNPGHVEPVKAAWVTLLALLMAAVGLWTPRTIVLSYIASLTVILASIMMWIDTEAHVARLIPDDLQTYRLLAFDIPLYCGLVLLVLTVWTSARNRPPTATKESAPAEADASR